MDRVKLGVLVIEQTNGEVAVQMFEQPDSMMESFNNLDDSNVSRATFLNIRWVDSEVRVSGSLPHNIYQNGRAWKLGYGPIPDPEYQQNQSNRTFLNKLVDFFCFWK